ncbi:MAG: hypothetical protein LBT66_08680 [Methanobrevibacter sp.]|jgi:hypothetical protein|nr:hypothetical protein [Candidatus Methanovirga meridionalis]
MKDKTKNNLKRFLISLTIYTFSFTIFNSYISLPDKVDPAIILISLFPLIYGPWGIVGLSIGDLIARILFTQTQHIYTIPEALFFSFIVLIISSFIYKLYYSFDSNKQISTMHLYESYNLIKFIIIILVSNAVYVFIHVYIAIAYSGSLLPREFIGEFINNFIFMTNTSLIFSILFILIAGLANVNIYKPKKTRHELLSKYLKPFSAYLKSYSGYLKSYSKFINILLFIYTVALFIMIVMFFSTGIHDENNGILIIIDLFFIIFLVILKPITKEIIVKKNKAFNEFLIFIFMFLSVFSVLFSIIILSTPSYFNPVENEFILDKIFNTINTFLNHEITLVQILITFIISIGLMKYLEHDFSKPLSSISEITENYVLNKLNNED